MDFIKIHLMLVAIYVKHAKTPIVKLATTAPTLHNALYAMKVVDIINPLQVLKLPVLCVLKDLKEIVLLIHASLVGQDNTLHNQHIGVALIVLQIAQVAPVLSV